VKPLEVDIVVVGSDVVVTSEVLKAVRVRVVVLVSVSVEVCVDVKVSVIFE